MGATGGLAVSGAATAASAYNQSRAMEVQGRHQERMAAVNADLAEMQAKDAIKRGDKEAVAHKKKAKQLIGAQRANFAAQGIEIDDGSALEIQDDTAAIAAEDAMTIKNNAWRQAWGFRMEAASTRGQGAFAGMAARNQAANTLLTGGMQALGYGMQAYGKYQENNASKKYQENNASKSTTGKG